MTSAGCSTTQITARSRRASRQISQISSSVQFPHSSQKRTRSFASWRAPASASASSVGVRRRWKASRCAVRAPTPGSRVSCATRFSIAGLSTRPLCLSGSDPTGGKTVCQRPRSGTVPVTGRPDAASSWPATRNLGLATIPLRSSSTCPAPPAGVASSSRPRTGWWTETTSTSARTAAPAWSSPTPPPRPSLSAAPARRRSRSARRAARAAGPTGSPRSGWRRPASGRCSTGGT